jgi:hypothetical protein
MVTYIEQLEIRLIDLKEEYSQSTEYDENMRLDIEELEEEIFQYYENK